MDEERVKRAVLSLIERALDAHALAGAVGAASAPESAQETAPESARESAPDSAAGEVPAAAPAKVRANKLLSRVVLGDILDDAILEARPADRTFPLRAFFGELGTLLGSDEDDDGEKVHAAELAFTLASGLNFFFRAEMDGDARARVALEVSRAFYTLAHEAALEPELVQKAAPLLAALMSAQLERVKLESVDHVRVFDSQIHERTHASDPTSSRVRRPASFLARVTANNAVKAKAQVVT